MSTTSTCVNNIPGDAPPPLDSAHMSLVHLQERALHYEAQQDRSVPSERTQSLPTLTLNGGTHTGVTRENLFAAIEGALRIVDQPFDDDETNAQ